MELVCVNRSSLHLSSNLVFYKSTKHIEVECQFIKEKILSRVIKTSFLNSKDQLGDIFTKSLCGLQITYKCDKRDA